MIFAPSYIEESNKGEKSYEIFSKLQKERIIFLFDEINDNLAAVVIAQLILLDALDSKKDIHIYINSPGGSVTAGLAIYDTMNHVKAPISTICVGRAASMAALLLAGGTKGKRYALENSQVMIHQVLGAANGQATDIEITAKNILRYKDNITKLMSRCTGQCYEKIAQDTERDYYLSSEEAKAYGLIDSVVID